MEGIFPVDGIGRLIGYSFKPIEIEVAIVSASISISKSVAILNQVPFGCDS